MKILRVINHLTRADFLERVRRSSFLIVLAITVGAGYLFVPPVEANYRVLQVGSQRGIYNSAWVGLMFGLIAALHLPFAGFYLVKNAVERDRRTGVGQIIATTPISKLIYVIGKWLSNLAVLVLILSAMTLMAVVMQLIRAEDTSINLWALIAPIWLMGLPVLAIAAAMATLFECVSFLRGGFGNVAYFFCWIFALGMVLGGGINQVTGRARPANDLFGWTRQMTNIQEQILSVDPEADVGTGLIIVGKDIERIFVWDGFHWTVGIILERMLWAGMAMVIALIAAVLFDRFDPARRKLRAERAELFSRAQKRIEAIQEEKFHPGDSAGKNGIRPMTAAYLTSIDAEAARGNFFGILAVELKLMLRGHSFIWYAGAIGLTVGCLISPMDGLRRILLPVVWAWPVLVWSQMGVREHRYNTEQIVFSAPRPILHQIPAVWLAGVIFTIIMGSGGWLRLLLMGEITGVMQWLAGALFIPALALGLGIWVGNSRLFEATYLFIWYLGLVEGIAYFDFAGFAAEGAAREMAWMYFAAAIILLGVAAGGRRRQLRA